MKTIRFVSVGVLSAALTLAAAATASAGVKTIWPHQLKPYFSGENPVVDSMADGEAHARHLFNFASATDSTGVTYMAPVKLKPGTRITKFSVSADAAGSGTVKAYLLRAGVDGSYDGIASIVWTNPPATPEWRVDDEINLPMVRAGFKYFVRVFVSSQPTRVYGLRVVYQ